MAFSKLKLAPLIKHIYELNIYVQKHIVAIPQKNDEKMK